ncbi:DUF1353 domain-containing protein [Marinobacter nauticus]|uniref:DUF1353 domain-containing protein n=1 Tax=Marinobacter nauticus TaxID=2743 RepID=A0A833JR25_MARNT|nr:DUF1353 domain-containing protein [Marinobacter nauticus]KAE8546133.1 hypothetical protein F6453_1379 [Marinobacter nauticus]
MDTTVLQGGKWFSDLVHKYVENGQWVLTQSLFYFGTADPVIVPAGFRTDLDSVPRVPVVYAAFKGRAVRAAVVHDYLYASQQGKRFADQTFLKAMKHEGVPARWRYPIYWAVVLFGGSIYERKRS